jgi:hypothetical protein
MWCNRGFLQGLGFRFAYDITMTLAIYAHIQVACKTPLQPPKHELGPGSSGRTSWDIRRLFPLEPCTAKTSSSFVGARLSGRLTPVRNA